MGAISGIDQALYDIAGKHLGVPVHLLLGGRVRDHVRVYDHLGGGSSDAVYGLGGSDDALADLATASVEQGFDALKFLPMLPSPGPLLSAADVDAAAARVATVRNAVGPHVDLMLDLHGRVSWPSAIAFAEAVSPLRPWFIEEPCQPEDTEALARVAGSTTIPIASGERKYTRFELLPILRAGACAVVQPDVCHAGGLTEMRKIATLADTHSVLIAPHNPLGPIATQANVHLALATPNFLIQEVMRADVPWRADVVRGAVEIGTGRIDAPLSPGLGIDIDERAAAHFPFEPEPQLRTRARDGAVADW